MAQQQFENVMSQDYLKGLDVFQTVKSDLSFSEIKDTCNELNIDMIVMGSHGVSGLREVFIGSNAEKVVRSSKVPVLVIKNNHENFLSIILFSHLILKMTAKKLTNRL